uniref:Cystatin domain-containing protein n=1 Tax=Cucumis melo TaxID=3656 RepID=A0A9I9EIT9_CUCME
MSCVEVPPNTYDPIVDVNSPTVVEAGKMAVEEHNKKENDNLVFVRVVSGLTPRVIVGILLWSYIIVIEAKTCSGYPVAYVAEIVKYFPSPPDSYKLISFNPILMYK